MMKMIVSIMIIITTTAMAATTASIARVDFKSFLQCY